MRRCDGGFRHSWTIVTCANGPSPILVRAITEPPGTPEVHAAQILTGKGEPSQFLG